MSEIFPKWQPSGMGLDRRKCRDCLAHVHIDLLNTHNCDPLLLKMNKILADKQITEGEKQTND